MPHASARRRLLGLTLGGALVATLAAVPPATARPPAPDAAGAVPGTATAPTARRAPLPGAPGIGDDYFPTYGNGGYDVAHYDLSVRWAPRTNTLQGRAGIRARATQDLSRFNLDLVGFRVSSITVDGRRARWAREGQELKVSPSRPLRRGATFTVAVTYTGTPAVFGVGTPLQAGWVRTSDGGAIAVGEPEVAAGWFPVNDHPRDKATYRISITAPNRFTSLSNGRLVAKRTRSGETTSTWAEDDPMVSYLALVAIGDYDVRSYRSRGLPVVDGVQSGLGARGEAAKRALDQEDEILRFLEGRFGRYPFDDLGGVVADPQVGFALENQTRPFYAPGFFRGQREDVLVVVHELAHQWYGDSVAVDRWRDIWLNEGFATYSEWLWSEPNGLGTAQANFDALARIPAGEPVWKTVVADPGPDELFSFASYSRGAMTLHALRRRVGDRAFFTILRRWAAGKQDGNGSTPEFIELAEEVSGRQLDGFFREWLYKSGKPAGLPEPAAGQRAQPAPRAAADLLRRLEAGHRH